MSEIHFMGIFKDDKIDSLMHAVDMFEKGKVIGHTMKFSATHKNPRLSWNMVKKTMSKIAEQKADMLIMLHVEGFTSNGETRLNSGKINPYVDPQVRIVSDGRKFYMLHDMLKSMKIDHEITQDMYIRF